MTDEEILAEIERQEKRFADAGFGRGLRLAHSAREYYAEMMETRRRALAAEEECREAEREISELMAAAVVMASYSRRRGKVRKMMTGVLFVLFAVASGRLMAGTELLTNGGFETVAADGVPNGWTKPSETFRYAAGAGRSLTRGLVYDVPDASRYFIAGRRIDLKAGMRYRLAGWIRTENVKGGFGARFGLEFYDANGKYIAPGLYTPGLKGTSDDWTFVTTEIESPTNAARAVFLAFLAQGGTGKVWFDDLSVTEVSKTLIDGFVSSAYRDRASGGDVTFSAVINADDKMCRAHEVTVKFRLPDGNCSWNVHEAEIHGGVARLTVPVSSLPFGKHPVQVMVSARDLPQGREVGELFFERTRQDATAGVIIDTQGRTLVDGKPFFPLGMYLREEPGVYDHYAKGPFNCVMFYEVVSPTILDECHKRGLKVIGCIKDAFAGWYWPPRALKIPEDDVAYVTDKVLAAKDHPALLAWYADDEMGVEWVPRLRKRRDLLHYLDPNHPVWTVQYQIEDYHRYAGTFDVAGTDIYPICRNPKGDDIACPAKVTRKTRERALATRALWQVPQFFDVAAYGKIDHPTSAPTEDELSCMVWQCIAEGANGIVIFARHALRKMDCKEPFERKWAEACRVGQEVRSKFDVLLSEDATSAVKIERMSENVSVRAWRQDGRFVVLAVNASYEPGWANVSAGRWTHKFDLKPLAHAFWAK